MVDIPKTTEGKRSLLSEATAELGRRAGASSGMSNATPTAGVETSYRSLDTVGPSQTTEALRDFTVDSGSFSDRKKTIMETFADRRRLAQEGGAAERELVGNRAGEDIESQLDANASQYIQSMEGRSGFGTKTAAVRYLENTGAKRITDLERKRDDLMLQSKIGEASRLDNLIAMEQEAITNARTEWVNSLLNIGQQDIQRSQENRALASFETPQQARQAEFEMATQQAERGAIQELALVAPDAGILSTDSYDEAVAKYRNSESYRRNERAAELELDKVEADIANTRSLAFNRGLTSGGGGGGDISVGLGSSDPVLSETRNELDRVASNVMNLIPSENGKEAFQSSYNMARTDSERIDAISSAVLANSPAEVRNDFRQQSDGMRQLDEAIALIDQGVDTGVLEAGSQYVYNIFGQDYDPNLAAINAYITAAIQPYRSSITGAAWGRQEDNEYEQLFGDTSYEPEELRSRLVRLKAILNNKSINAITNQVSPFGNSTFNLFESSIGGGTAQSTPSTGMFNEDDL